MYRTTIHTFGAPDWDHRPFATGRAAGTVTRRVQRKKRSRGKATVKATFRPTAGGGSLTASTSLTLRR